jgi:glucosamine--fructose-6-phosphate aminotransferase (isomerizing)
MCGIVACRTHAPAIDYLLTALRRLEYRGYDSVGVAVQTTSGGIARFRTVERVGALETLVSGWTGPALDGVGIGHTRWATHGPVSEQNAHPHSDCSGRISLVHNGIIDRSDRLRHALALSGHHLNSDVDSEVLCHLIEDQLEISGDLCDAVQAALTPLDGSWALAVLEQGTGRVVLAAQRSPLLVARTAGGVFAASDIAAVSDWVDEFRVLDEGEVVDLTDAIGFSKGRATPTVARCHWNAGDAELHGYVDYMAKEIDEQPAAACRLVDSLAGSVASGQLWTERGLTSFDRLRVIGCGSSLNAGRVIGNVARRVGGVPVTFTIASEAAEESRDDGQLCLAISQSGETADVLGALGTNSVAGSTLVALTNNPHSSLARRADAVVTLDAGPEIGVAATKTFISEIIAGAALMISALVATDRISRRTAQELTDDLRRIPEQIAEAIKTAKCDVPPLTEQLQDCNGFIFIARGSAIPYAAEGALKLKELTYRWAEHYPAGELKHGPLALVSAGTPVVVIDNAEPRLAANVAEVQARGGRIICIGSAGSTVPVVEHPGAAWGPIESTIALQILARTLALSLERDVDKPRNLAKSVTVE